jgi:hypothetical protein
MALSTDARHNGMLHLGADNYTDDEIADLAVNTIRDIVSGELPPGTSSLIRITVSQPLSAHRRARRSGTRWDETGAVTLRE